MNGVPPPSASPRVVEAEVAGGGELTGAVVIERVDLAVAGWTGGTEDGVAGRGSIRLVRPW